MFSKGKSSLSYDNILEKVSEMDILRHYVGVQVLPSVINSPFRNDSSPSLGWGLKDNKIMYHDFATKDKGGIIDYLMKLWNLPFSGVIARIADDLPNMTKSGLCKPQHKTVYHKVESILEVKTREWRSYDEEYWNTYGISIKILKYAEVYPISHTIITKNGRRSVFATDKYAYVYVEHKEGKTSLKVYQPLRSTTDHKWINKHDGSVIALWTKVPREANTICICSSVKDALCLWNNTGIPAIAPQGEGYKLSKSAIESLKSRYKNVCILYDNDTAGIEDAKKLAEETGFYNIVLPQFEGGKDVSDYFKYLHNKDLFRSEIINLFNQRLKH